MERGRGLRRWMRVGAALMLPVFMVFTGCSGFFPPINNSGGSTGGGGTGDFVYVANGSKSSIGGFTVGTGTLTAISGLPSGVGYVPVDGGDSE
jgi:6-phosphogluconolactonase